ncbi:MAG: addiction module toxin RelE [Sphingobacteriaceae bacterium]
MTNEVIPTPVFIKKVKRFKKKFTTLPDTILALEQDLLKNPRLGVPYGKNIYKVRISDESKGRGKSGGFRIITYVINETDDCTSVYLITILDKSEESTIKKATVLDLVEKCGL